MNTISTIDELTAAIGVKADVLMSLLANTHALYLPVRRKKKKDGGYRLIREPNPALKAVQRLILGKILSPILAAVDSESQSHVVQARKHTGKPFVFVTDIESFFPSIKQGRITHALSQHGFSGEALSALVRLTTRDWCIPQGVPTSSAMADLVFAPIDRRVRMLCSKLGLVYTRYVDDLSISGSDIGQLNQAKAMVNKILRDNRYRTAEAKTHIWGPKKRHEIMGIVVNDAPSLSKTKRKLIEARLHSVTRNSLPLGMDAGKTRRSIVSAVGYLEYVEGNKATSTLKKIRRLLRSISWPA